MGLSTTNIYNKLSNNLKSSILSNVRETLSFIKTDLVSLDIILGGGIPRKHVTEVYGMSGTGKSSLALQIIAAAHRQGHDVLYIDSEHMFDFTYVKKLGINEDKLIVMFPTSADQIMDFVPNLLAEVHVPLVVIDTVCSSLPQVELDRDFTESYKSLQGRFWAQAIPKLLTSAREHNTAMILLNQVRDHIGTTKKIPTNIGSVASRSTLRLKTESVGMIEDEGITLGERILVRINKNLLGRSNQAIELDMYYDSGFSIESDLIEVGLQKNIISRRGTWYYFNEELLGQGKSGCIERLISDKVLLEQIKEHIGI
jgi:recombination protein RecA